LYLNLFIVGDFVNNIYIVFSPSLLMRDDRLRVFAMAFFVVVVFAAVLVNYGLDLRLTGYAVLGGDGNFSGGVYSDTEWNGSAIVLSEGEFSGSYLSEVFDADNEAVWENVSWVSGEFGELSADQNSVLLLHMNEESGEIVDFSGEGNDGDYNGVLYSEEGKIGDAVGFDGNNDLIYTPLYLSDLEAFTISAWYYRDSTSYRFDISECEDNNKQRVKLIRHMNGQVYGVVQSGNSGSYGYFADNSVGWKHLTMVFNGSASDNEGRLKIYSDGDLQSLTFSGEIPSSTPTFTNSLEIGHDIGSQLYSRGAIDEVGVWERAFTDDEVRNLYVKTSLDLDLSVRSCDDESCSEEDFVFVDTSSSFQNLSVDDNNYFQYKFDFSRSDEDYTPFVSNFSAGYYFANEAPELSIVSPMDGLTYGYNEDIPLNFNVEDIDDNAESCWYSLNGGGDVLVPGCLNFSFDALEGGNDLIVYVNDSYGEMDSESISFNVDLGVPTVVLSSPDGSYLPDGDVDFSYFPSDVDLKSCVLLGNFSGEFAENESDSSVQSGIENTFSLSLDDGYYLWSVECEDYQGGVGVGNNFSFVVDSVAPSLLLSEPSGVSRNRSLVPLSFDVDDFSNVSCWYNVFRGENVEIGNTSVDCFEDSSFSVTLDADFSLNFYVNDSAGNLNFSSSDFSVDSSEEVVIVTPPSSNNGGGGGGGGGGSGGFIMSSGSADLQVDPIGAIVSVGEEKSLLVSVKNNGKTTANKCSLVGGGEYVESEDIFNVGVGEIVEVMMILNVLNRNISEMNLSIECLDDVFGQVPLSVTFLNSHLDVSIEEISFDSDNEVAVSYSIEPLSDLDQVLLFRVSNSIGGIVAEAEVPLNLISGEIYENVTVIDLSDVESGMLKVSVTDKEKVSFIEEDFIYGGGVGVTGFALLSDDVNVNYVGIVILVLFVAAGFLGVRIWKLWRHNKK
jgi:hypothetical protein